MTLSIRPIISARCTTRVPMAPAPNANNSVFFCACRWQRCCCLYGTETSACPRFMGTIGQDAAHPLSVHLGRRKLSAMGIAKLVANRKCLFRFHVSKADVFVAIDGSMSAENVRFGSLADITALPGNVRFNPNSGHRLFIISSAICWRHSGDYSSE